MSRPARRFVRSLVGRNVDPDLVATDGITRDMYNSCGVALRMWRTLLVFDWMAGTSATGFDPAPKPSRRKLPYFERGSCHDSTVAYHCLCPDIASLFNSWTCGVGVSILTERQLRQRTKRNIDSQSKLQVR